MDSRKSWHERLHSDKYSPEIRPIPDRLRKNAGDGTILIPSPREVDSVIRGVPKGKLITIQAIAAKLAVQHDATIGCTVTTGIFAWLVANAAAEAERAGAKRVSPYWRVVKVGGELNPKYPGGIANLRSRLEDEGHRVIRNGRRHCVEEYEASLVKI